MAVTAPDKSSPQLWIYLLISSVFVFPVSLLLFMVFNPYRLLEPVQHLIAVGLMLLVGLSVISSIVYIFELRNIWVLFASIGLLTTGVLIFSLLNDTQSVLELLASVSMCVGPIAALVIAMSGLKISSRASRRNNSVQYWRFFLAASLILALTTFLVLGYMIQGYEVVQRERLSDRTYYLIGNSNQIYGPSIALYRCDTRGILCRQLYFSGVKSPFSAYQIDVRGETLEFSVGSSVILTETLNADD